MNLLTHPRALLAALFGAACAWCGNASAAGVTYIGEPIFQYRFTEIESDGLGGLHDEFEVVRRVQFGGAVDQSYSLTRYSADPHERVYSDAGAITFWTEVTTPQAGLFPPKHAIIGGTSELTILQTYRKDEPGATIRFTINDILLSGLEFGGPRSNIGLEGRVGFRMLAYDVSNPGPQFPVIDRFESLTRLSGRGLDWDLENSGPLALDMTGSLDGPRVRIDLLAPYSREIDVSSIEVGGLFTVEFVTSTSAFDTVQFDSRIQAYGRDPLDPARGSFFEIEGLTPMNGGPPAAVPEPASPALMVAVLAVVACWRGRARRGP